MTKTDAGVSERKAIARLVDPTAAWGHVVETNSAAHERILLALAKADRILALRSTPVPQCDAEPVAWRACGRAGFNLVADNVTHGEVVRGIEQTWSAYLHSRSIGRGFEIEADAKAAVERAYREHYTAPARCDAAQEELERARKALEDIPNLSDAAVRRAAMIARNALAHLPVTDEAGRETTSIPAVGVTASPAKEQP